MSSVLDRVAAPADRTVSYGPAPDQVYAVRLPAGSPLDVTVVIVHGGFWRPATDCGHTGPQAQALADHGFHVVVPEYRRAARGGWPQLSTDLITALDTATSDPDLPECVILVGHSAGGHLVTWLAVQGELRIAHRIRGVIALAACVDLHLVHTLGLGKGAAQALMGSSPAQQPRAWRQADPAMLGTPPMPVALVHGSRDEHVPLSVSQSYTAAVPQAQLRVIDGADHFDLIDPQSAAFATVTATITSLAAGSAR